MASTQLTNSQWAVVSVQPKDRLGSIAPITGLTAVSSSPEVASIEVFGDAENRNFKLTGLSSGFTQITFTAQNEVGDTLTAILDVQVTAELAVTLDILVGEPQDQ